MQACSHRRSCRPHLAPSESGLVLVLCRRRWCRGRRAATCASCCRAAPPRQSWVPCCPPAASWTALVGRCGHASKKSIQPSARQQLLCSEEIRSEGRDVGYARCITITARCTQAATGRGPWRWRCWSGSCRGQRSLPWGRCCRVRPPVRKYPLHPAPGSVAPPSSHTYCQTSPSHFASSKQGLLLCRWH